MSQAHTQPQPASGAAAGIELSPQQRRVWRQQGEAPFAQQLAIEVAGELDGEALHAALAVLVRRWEILRTVFTRSRGGDLPFQAVLEELAPSYRETELGHLPADEVEARLAALLAEDRELPFDLAAGPLLRVRRVILGPGRSLLSVCLPALCADAPGLEAVLRGWGEAYAATLRGEAFSSEVLQYADYSVWQHELLHEEESAVGKGYWRDSAATAALELNLAWERRVAVDAPFRPASRSWRIGPELAARIAAAARGCESTPGTFLLACWSALLAGQSGREDLVVAVVCDGRAYEDLAGAPGLLSRWLPLRARIDRAVSFEKLTRSLHAAWQEGESWQEYFSWPGDAEPSFSAGFELAAAGEPPRFGGRPAAWHTRQGHLERFKLHLRCREEGDGLRIEIHADSRRFESAAVEGLGRQLLALVADAALRPTAAAQERELLDVDERRRLLVDLNRTAVAIAPLCIHDLFARAAARHPRRQAVVCAGEGLTYARLDEQSSRLARHLRRRGVGAEVPVGICLDRSASWLVALLGVLKAGGAYVPLDPDSPAERLRAQLREARIPVLVTGEALLARLPGLPAAAVCLDRDRAAIEAEEGSAPEASVDPSSLAYVIFTSGSTGTPKGVGVSHRSLVSYTEHVLRRLGTGIETSEGLGFATVSTFAADLGNTAIFPALLSGGTLHVFGYEDSTDAGRFAESLARHPVDVLKIVPSHLRALLAEGGPAVLPRRFLFLGGEELGADLASALLEAAPGCTVINHYGPTETTVGCMTCEVTAETVAGAAVPVGRPIANARVFVADDGFRPVPAGFAGEILIGGAGLARGYLNRPDLTAERFMPDPFSGEPGARLYRSGDRACHLPDGNVRFLGRTDDQLKIRGYRVEPGEVRAALLTHPGIRDAAVLAVEETPGRQRLVAWVVGAEGTALSTALLPGFLADRLPEPMLPSAFVVLDALPLTRNGKLDRKALPAPVAAARAARVPPGTPVEKLLAGVWSQTLGVPEVGIRDNFFELGGDSILSIQIVARARREGCLVNVKQIFDHPTIEELARVAGTAEAVQAEQGAVVGPVPLTAVQRRLFTQELPAPHHFNMSLLLRLRRPIDPRWMAAAVGALLAHHDALRFRFRQQEGVWSQSAAAPGGPAPSHVVDLSEIPERRQRAALEEAAGTVQRSLDLEHGPLLRAALFDLGPERPGRLLLVVHHLVMDAVSWRLLLEDFQSAYRSLERGESIVLPPKTTSFRQWAECLVPYASSEALGEAGFWTSMARRAVRPLPLDAVDAADLEGLVQTVSVALDEIETRALLQEVPAAREAQVHEVLLTALALSIARWTGGRSVLVDLEGHGREELFADVDLSRTLGWFTTHYPVLLDLGRTVTPVEALREVKEQVRRIPRRGIGFGLLRYLDASGEVAAALAGLAIPEVGFNYLGSLDQVLPESDLLAPAPEFPGAERDPRAPRAVRLLVNADVAGGCLRLHWSYGERLFRRETVHTLAESFLDSVRAIVAGSQETERQYTPADFPDVDLGREELDRILQQVGSAGSRGSSHP